MFRIPGFRGYTPLMTNMAVFHHKAFLVGIEKWSLGCCVGNVGNWGLDSFPGNTAHCCLAGHVSVHLCRILLKQEHVKQCDVLAISLAGMQ